MRKFLPTLLIISALSTGPAPLAAEETQARPPSIGELEKRAVAGDMSAYVALGDAYRDGNGVPQNTQKAITWYRPAAAQGDINANFFIGYLLMWQGNPEDHREALAFYHKALDLCMSETQRDTCNPMVIYRQISGVQKDLALYNDALKSAKAALAIAENPATRDELTAGYLYEDIGIIHDSLGLDLEALANYDKAAEIYTRLKGPDGPEMGNLLLNRANSLENMGRYDESVAASRRAIPMFAKDQGADAMPIGILHNNIGWALVGAKRYEEAFLEFERALPIVKKHKGPAGETVGYILNNMGIIRERQGRHQEAISLNLRALTIYARFDDISKEPRRWALQSLSKSYAALGRRDTAILFAKLAVNTQQLIRSQNVELASHQANALTEQWRGIYQELADLLVGEGRIAEAQYVLDLLKEQELIEFVRRDSTADTRSGATSLNKSEQKKSEELKAAMAAPLALVAELDALTAKQNKDGLSEAEEQRMEALNDALDKSYEAYVTSVEDLLRDSEAEAANVRDEVNALNLEYAADRQDMLRQFEKPTVLLQAASLKDGLNLFLTTKDLSIHRQVAVTRADLSKLVFDTLRLIEDRSPDADAKLAELYGLLIKPVEQDLRDSGAEVVMLNLGGFLRYLPFAALRSDHGYLVEDYALALDTPAAQTRFSAADRKKAAAAGFGVTVKHEGFSPLPGVAKELEAIFEGQDKQGELPGDPKLDADFTEDSLKDALKHRPQLLHVASHFKFVPGNETDSFLLLGNGDPLTLAQIRKGRGFRFGGVDLLTLSACETAKGSDGEGDEVESFGAIAQMNGASAVMATLWPIADEASGKLMADFYKGLVEDGLDKADALRRAQIAMLRGVAAASVDLTARGASDAEDEPDGDPPPADATSRHPYYWSPYILMGNWL